MHRISHFGYNEMEFEFPQSFKSYHHHQQSVLHRLGFEPSTLLTNASVNFQQYFKSYASSRPDEDLNDQSVVSSAVTQFPLDLSIKSTAPPSQTLIITPPNTPSPSAKRDGPALVTPPEVPTKKKTNNNNTPIKKNKVTRKLHFDEDNSSPVSGTIIRELRPDETLVVRKGDIDPAFNVVEITEEAKAELAKIENHIGEYVCRLCKELYEDAFGLAQHRCSRIVHVEYRCPECDKVFNCPANLASHRRWHKPRPNKDNKDTLSSVIIDGRHPGGDNNNGEATAENFACEDCGKRFRRIAYLRKHQMTHQID